jgi:hypothetical protein
MLNRIACVLAALLAVDPPRASAQTPLTPTSPPTVSAESEPWYLSRVPLIFGGYLYYPSGPQEHFNRNEMVRTAYVGAIPLYTRTTVEPFSVILVPLSGGLMQPYARRRSGELAGTAGTSTPSFPVPISSAIQAQSDVLPVIPQAQGPPTGVAPFDMAVASPLEAPLMSPAENPARPVGTTGTNPSASRAMALRSVEKPSGLNGIFIDFQNERWFSSGPAVAIETARFRQIGRYDGLPVYVEAWNPDTIYVPVVSSAATLVAPYSTVRHPSRR